jgi:histidine triad (HIT) family protein
MRVKEGCIFCAIVAGKAPAHRVAEDEQALAFLDLFPVSDGHTLVIPKDHAENVFEMQDGPMRAVAARAPRAPRANRAQRAPPRRAG